MNITITELQSPLVMSLYSQPKTFDEKIKYFIQLVKQTSAAQAVQEWETLFFRDYDHSSSLDAEKERTASALCFLLSNSIGTCAPQYIDDLKQLIQEALPQSKDADQFIFAYKQKETSYLLHELREDLFQEGNRINGIIVEKYCELEKELLLLNEKRELSAHQLYERLDAVKVRIGELMNQLKNILEEAKES